jgi:hypothetical protein
MKIAIGAFRLTKRYLDVNAESHWELEIYHIG